MCFYGYVSKKNSSLLWHAFLNLDTFQPRNGKWEYNLTVWSNITTMCSVSKMMNRHENGRIARAHGLTSACVLLLPFGLHRHWKRKAGGTWACQTSVAWMKKFQPRLSREWQAKQWIRTNQTSVVPSSYSFPFPALLSLSPAPTLFFLLFFLFYLFLVFFNDQVFTI